MSGPMSAGMTTNCIAVISSERGKVRTSARRPTGVIIAPPIPCKMRDATSIGTFTESPHASDPSVNSATATANTRRVPKRSAIQPLIGMKTARLSV